MLGRIGLIVVIETKDQRGCRDEEIEKVGRFNAPPAQHGTAVESGDVDVGQGVGVGLFAARTHGESTSAATIKPQVKRKSHRIFILPYLVC